MDEIRSASTVTTDLRRRVGRTSGSTASTVSAPKEASFASILAARNLASMGYEPNGTFAQYQYSFRPAVNVTFSKEALQLYKDTFNLLEEPNFA